MRVIDITTTSSIAVNLIDDTYVHCPGKGFFRITIDGTVQEGRIDDGDICISDIAKCFFTVKHSEATEVVPYRYTAIVTFYPDAGSSYTCWVTIIPKYSQTELLQNWCYTNTKYYRSVLGTGDEVDVWGQHYDQTVFAGADKMVNFIVPAEDVLEVDDVEFRFDDGHKVQILPCTGYSIHYVNQLGGWSTYCLRKDPTPSHQSERQRTRYRHHYQPIITKTTRKWDCITCGISKEEYAAFWTLLESPCLVLQTPDNEFIPVICTKDDWKGWVRTDGPVPHCEFTLEESRQIHRYTNFIK